MDGALPKISVIIPSYNRAHLIGETLDSVMNQTFKDFEVIVVDDGSTDETAEVIKSYGDVIRYIKIENSGQSIATNTGILAARGEYVALLDSDDLWDERFLELLYHRVSTSDEFDFSYCNYLYFDGDEVIYDEFIIPEKRVNGNVFDLFMEGTLICTGSYLIRKDDMVEIGMLDPSIPVVTDWDVWLRISHRFTGAFVDECLVRIRKHPDRLSHQIAEISRCNLIVLYRIKSRYPEAFRKHYSTLLPQLQRNHRIVAGHLRKEWKLFSAGKHYLLSFKK
ncbi:MAG: glycosyltransferase [Roseivirga sp.]|nr:glycosyltransferase [Roseivirga sp.]